MADDSKAESIDMIGPRPSPSPQTTRPRGTARGAAVRMLARRDHASGELRAKLLRKGFPPEDVETALGSLAASGYLDDARWAAGFVLRELEAGRGWNWIRLKLSAARAPVPPPVTSTAEARSVLALLDRRRVDPSALTDPRERAKIIRFLRGRGFRTAAISTVLGARASDLSDEEP